MPQTLRFSAVWALFLALLCGPSLGGERADSQKLLGCYMGLRTSAPPAGGFLLFGAKGEATGALIPTSEKVRGFYFFTATEMLFFSLPASHQPSADRKDKDSRSWVFELSIPRSDPIWIELHFPTIRSDRHARLMTGPDRPRAIQVIPLQISMADRSDVAGTLVRSTLLKLEGMRYTRESLEETFEGYTPPIKNVGRVVRQEAARIKKALWACVEVSRRDISAVAQARRDQLIQSFK